MTNNEQLLMNIVRLRYVEPVTNLKLTNVTSSYTFNPSISTAGTGIAFTSDLSPFLQRRLINLGDLGQYLLYQLDKIEFNMEGEGYYEKTA